MKNNKRGKTHNCKECYFWVDYNGVYGHKGDSFCRLRIGGEKCHFISKDDKASQVIFNIGRTVRMYKNKINEILDDMSADVKFYLESAERILEK